MRLFCVGIKALDLYVFDKYRLLAPETVVGPGTVAKIVRTFREQNENNFGFADSRKGAEAIRSNALASNQTFD